MLQPVCVAVAAGLDREAAERDELTMPIAVRRYLRPDCCC